MGDIKIVSEKEDKFMVGRQLTDKGVITIIIAKTNDGDEVDIVLDQKETNRLFNLIGRAVVVTTKDLNDLYCLFENKYNPYPIQMSREEAFRRALNDEWISKDTYDLAKRYYGNLWHYVGD